MSKKGLPIGLKMRHDSHYVDELAQTPRFIGRIIKISKIEPNPDQPRVEMGDLSELIASIKEKGVLEPLLVKPFREGERYLIIAGERRWRAAQLAGLSEVPCVELNVNDQEVAEIALIENLQRKDLTIWEEADAYQALCQRFGYTHEDLAKKLSKSRSSVTETLTISSLPVDIRQKCIEAGIQSKAAILKIARKFDESEMLSEIQKNLVSGHDVNLKDYPVYSKEDSSSKARNDSSLNVSKDNDVESSARKTIFPLKVYKFQSDKGSFKLELKFKRPSQIDDLENALNQVLDEINELRRT